MLSAILTTIGDAGRPMCLADLSAALGIDEAALEGMLQTLIDRGRLRAIEYVDRGCSTCPVKGGCFIMNEGVARTYALPFEPAAAARALPHFS